MAADDRAHMGFSCLHMQAHHPGHAVQIGNAKRIIAEP